ncbi:MAG TPA: hypothetical protein VEH62_14815 [Gemmatimonadales bacterium]|nr:hypothetical protein [Gemmatimonadales bacterium]
MSIGPSRSRTAVLTAVVAGAGLACGCEMATLSDQGPIRPATLVFSLQPENTTAGSPLQPGVGVTVLESNGDTAFEATVTIQISIASGTGKGGAHLGGVTQVAAVNGTALFPSVTIDSAGSGYQLLAAAAGLGGAASDTFTVSAGAPVKLVFTRQPTATPAGDTIGPAVQVAAQDGIGNTAPFWSDTITLAIGANPGPGTLGGVTSRLADSGLATFPGLTVSAAGAGYTLVATARGFSPVASAPFNVTAQIPPKPGVR